MPYQDDYASYSVYFEDAEGDVVLPDQNETLRLLFYDHDGVLQLTATLLSNPPITTGNDAGGDYIIVSNIPLTNFAVGAASVEVYGNIGGVSISPSPTLATPFEVLAAPEDYGYCTLDDVKQATGVKYTDLGLETEVSLNSILGTWITQITDIINQYCQTAWNIDAQPAGVTRAAISMMSNIVGVAIQRRKATFVRINDFAIKLVMDAVLTTEIKDMLHPYKVGHTIDSTTNLFGMGVFTMDETEQIEADEADES